MLSVALREMPARVAEFHRCAGTAEIDSGGASIARVISAARDHDHGTATV